MTALTVLIIRHGEKPDRQWPGPGLTRRGNMNAGSLVVRGWQRAGAWATLFGTDKPQPWSADMKTVTLTPASTGTDGFFFCLMQRKG